VRRLSDRFTLASLPLMQRDVLTVLFGLRGR
jgi:hypothetical protein